MKRPTPARREYTPHRVARIAWLAGHGWSRNEIAREIDSSRDHVKDILWRYKVPVVPKQPGQVALVIVVSKRAAEAARDMCLSSELEPAQYIARLVEAVLSEPTVAKNLMDEAADEN